MPVERPDPERLHLYRYLAGDDSGVVAEYVAIMGHFTGALLAEWSARDLIDRGVDIPIDVIEDRLKYLARHGNLLVSPREVRVASIAEYQRQPARYTVSTLGARIHREVEALLAASGGGREVPRELLALIAQGLERLVDQVADSAAIEPTSLAEQVSPLFLQFEAFASSVTDFYTYVGSVLSRADLDGDEWAGFKRLLLDYLETIVESVARYAPTVRAALDRLEPALPGLLARLSEGEADFEAIRAANPGGERVERARGRSEGDWRELRAWFDPAPGSGSRQIRDAAGRAVGSLLANLKRINAAASRETSLRRHFLRLAGWFDAATPDEAHVLFTSAFALYGARHLGFPLDAAVGEALPATTSWWQAPPAPVPVALRERGDRTPRGRSARVQSHGPQKERLLADRQAEAQRRKDACAELLAAGTRLDQIRLSTAALDVLLELLASANAAMGPAADGARACLVDQPVAVWLIRADRLTTIRSDGGRLVVEGFAVAVTGADAPVPRLTADEEGTA